MARIFKYGDQTWADPGAEFTTEDVKAQLTQFFPELARATAKERALPDGTTEIEFVKNAGTKGADIPQYAHEWAQAMGETLTADVCEHEARGWETEAAWASRRGDVDVEALARQRAAWMRQDAEVLRASA